MKIPELITKLLELANNKEYEEMLNLLNEHSNYIHNEAGELIFILTFNIAKIKKLKKVPEKISTKKDDYRRAIKDHDYALALNLCTLKLSTNNSKERKIITILLADINNLIKETSKTEEDIINKERTQRENKTKEIIKLLKENKIDEAKELLKEYLTSINAVYYQFLLNKLIDVSILLKDNEFENIKDLLNQISFSTTIIDFYSIKGKFNKILSKANLNVASIYLEIITHYHSTLKDKITKKDLTQYQTLLQTYQAEEVFLTQEISSLETQGLCATKLTNIPNDRKKILLTLSHNIPNIIIRESNPNELLLIICTKTKELTERLSKLMKIYDTDTTVKIFNESNNLLNKNIKYKLKEIAHYIMENNIPLKYIKVLFPLTDIEIKIIRLLIIEIHYTKEEYRKGDELLLQMNTPEELDPQLHNLLDYINKNKYTYKNTKTLSKKLIKLPKTN